MNYFCTTPSRPR